MTLSMHRCPPIDDVACDFVAQSSWKIIVICKSHFDDQTLALSGRSAVTYAAEMDFYSSGSGHEWN